MDRVQKCHRTLTNAQSRVVEELLMEAGVPYQLIGGTQFYDRREVKDALAYLRVTVNPGDAVSLLRALNTPKRGVGDGSVAKLAAWADAHGLTLTDVLAHAPEAGVKGWALSGINAFLKVIAEAREKLDDGPVAVLEHLLETSGYLDQLEAEAASETTGTLHCTEGLCSEHALAKKAASETTGTLHCTSRPTSAWAGEYWGHVLHGLD